MPSTAALVCITFMFVTRNHKPNCKAGALCAVSLINMLWWYTCIVVMLTVPLGFMLPVFICFVQVCIPGSEQSSSQSTRDTATWNVLKIVIIERLVSAFLQALYFETIYDKTPFLWLNIWEMLF